MPNSGADYIGKRIACELVLALAAQRGSLRYLLEWVEMALCASGAVVTQQSSSKSFELDAQSTPAAKTQLGTITHKLFVDILQRMKKSAVCT